MILACHNIEKAFGEEVIVSGGSFHIEDHEKAALVGPNGAGKTTLLKMIVGEILGGRRQCCSDTRQDDGISGTASGYE